MTIRTHTIARTAAAIGLTVLLLPARAALFEDDEARRAILDLRARVERSEKAALEAEERARAAAQEQTAQLRRSLLELNNQIEALRAELATLRGSDEQLARDIADLQRRQKDIAQGVEDRMRKLEPQKVMLDGREFTVDQDEKRQFDDALAVMRRGDFAAAATVFGQFVRRWPVSGYRPAALFWLGNAQYGKRDYKEAMATFRTLAAESPDHPRAPEALLAIANCQIELKDTKSARKTIGDLLQTYPKSEAAQAGRERLAGLK